MSRTGRSTQGTGRSAQFAARKPQRTQTRSTSRFGSGLPSRSSSGRPQPRFGGTSGGSRFGGTSGGSRFGGTSGGSRFGGSQGRKSQSKSKSKSGGGLGGVLSSLAGGAAAKGKSSKAAGGKKPLFALLAGAGAAAFANRDKLQGMVQRKRQDDAFDTSGIQSTGTEHVTDGGPIGTQQTSDLG